MILKNKIIDKFMTSSGYVSGRLFHMVVFLGFIAWGFIIYSNTFDAPFAFDDDRVFAELSREGIFKKCALSGGGNR